jgi:hypothetical protein
MSGRQGRSSASAGHPVRVARPTPAAACLRTTSARFGHGLRLPVFTGTGTVLGVAAHTLATGALPDPALVVLATALVAVTGSVLRRRERSFEAIAAALVVAQAGVHAVLALGHVRPSPGYLAHLYPGHVMLVAHLLAAGVAAWWLRHGEAAVHAAAGWVWTGLPVPPGTAHVVRRAAVPPAAAPVTSGVRDAAVRRTPRRGPPRPPAPVPSG